LGWFASLASLETFGTTKSDKVLTEIFWIVLMKNDKTWTTNHVRGFWWQNQLILGWFASLASLASFGTTKSDKVLTDIFWGRTDGKR